MFTIVVTHLPGSMFGSDAPEALSEPRLFKCFRTPTDKYRWGRGPDVILFNEYRHAAPGSWSSREAAERNLARLTERGYVASITEEN